VLKIYFTVLVQAIAFIFQEHLSLYLLQTDRHLIIKTKKSSSNSRLKLQAKNIQRVNACFYAFHVSCVNQMHTFFKRPTNVLECMNVTVLHSNRRHVSATHMALCRVVRTRIQLQPIWGISSTYYNYNSILVLTTLKMDT